MSIIDLDKMQKDALSGYENIPYPQLEAANLALLCAVTIELVRQMQEVNQNLNRIATQLEDGQIAVFDPNKI